MLLEKIVFLVCSLIIFLALNNSTKIPDEQFKAEKQVFEKEFSKIAAPPNGVGIIKLLKQKGLLNNNSGQEEIDNALREYYRQKLVKNQASKSEDKSLILEKIDQTRTRSGHNYRRLIKKICDQNYAFKDKSAAVRTASSIAASGVKKPKLLVLLAQFSEDEYGLGPLHNEITKPGPDDNISLWVEDFDAAHYQKMLFTKGGYDAIDQNNKKLHLNSMVDYYLEMSNNSMEISGDFYGWYTLPHSEAYYGDDDPEGGQDNLLPGTSKNLVADLLIEAFEDGLAFEDYDVRDPYDLDDDDELDEPDGIIDHLVIIHAGVDQSSGGGAQGDNATWAHSSNVWVEFPADNSFGSITAYNYIIQGEDGTIGVFCHEFAHDLGLPDEYDTKHSGLGEPVGFYSLMSNGSWLGKPFGTKPAPISPWGRIELGKIHGGQWVQPTIIQLEDIPLLGKSYQIAQSTSYYPKFDQVVQVNLPKHKLELVPPYEGVYEWYGGRSGESDNSMYTAISLPEAENISLSYMTWYDIEIDWDFAFIQVSTDNGSTWQSLATPLTTYEHDPEAFETIITHLPGYSGKSEGWVADTADLTPYAGQEILLQLRYMTDIATLGTGIFFDELKVTAGDTELFSDGAEDEPEDWIYSGFKRYEGFELKDHYYLLEWRNYANTDISQQYCYSWKDYDSNIVQYYKNERGLLLWYRDTAEVNNWTGIHPGKVFLGIVDSHPEALFDSEGYTLQTQIQMHDAAFNKRVIIPKFLYLNEEPSITDFGFPSGIFTDYRNYWNQGAPHSGIRLINYGFFAAVMNSKYNQRAGVVRIFNFPPKQ